jgi:zinc transport system permease protein
MTVGTKLKSLPVLEENMDSISDFFELLSLFPIQKAFVAFIISGAVFPLVGVFAVVLNLIPLRFALMHGALLGGVVGLLFGSSSVIFPLLFCGLIVLLLGPFSERIKIGLSNSSAFFMITTVAIAFIMIDKAKISSMEAFNIFWGNIFALSIYDLVSIILLAFVIVFFIVLNFKKITAVMYDMDIAKSSGINAGLFYHIILVLTGLVVALSMKVLGAMLVDSILLLPAMGSLYFSKSIKKLFLNSALLGFVSAVSGFIVSIVFKIQPSPSVTITSVVILGCIYMRQKIKKTAIRSKDHD